MKLSYFGGGFQGKSEPIRSFAAACGVPLEFEAVDPATWGEKKATTPFGGLPLLTLDDGLVVAQEKAIITYIAETANKAGANPKEKLLIRMIDEALADAAAGWMLSELADDEKRKTHQAKVETILEKIAVYVGDQFAVGSSFTSADAVIWYSVQRYSFLFEGLKVPAKLATISDNFAKIEGAAKWIGSPEFPKAFLPAFMPFVKDNAYLMKRIADTSK